MLRVDKNALICDLAETYSIHDYEQIAPSKVAIFAIGLRDDSRIKMKLTDQKYDFKTLLMAKISDSFELLLWSKTRDGQKGWNRPNLILNSLYKNESEVSVFESGKDFEKEKQRILAERSEQHGN